MRIPNPLRAVAALLVAAALPAACGRAPAPPPSIVLIVVDTLRADRLGAYGSRRGLTPFLDQLAGRSTVFETAYAQSSWTNPSVASLFTSRYQSQHRVTSFTSELAADEITVAELLKRRGYATAGFSANFLVRGSLGFDQGFDHYATYSRQGSGEEKFIKERAERLNREALAWLDGVRAAAPPPPVFLYLHYMEPHNPYDPPPARLDEILAGRPTPDVDEINAAMRLAYMYPFDEPFVRSIETLYDAEIASLDAALRELFAALDARGLLDDAIVVVTADHGEEFLEHEFVGHHKSLYEPAIRIPLFVHLPGQARGATVDEFAELVDVAPTLLDLLGQPRPPRFAGQSLRPWLAGDGGDWSFAGLRRWLGGAPAPSREAFSELIKEPDAPRKLPHERAVIVGPTKLLVSDQGERSFYDLAADPGETNSLALDERRRARLDGALAELRAYADSGPSRQVAMDEETRERMRALGYEE